jgi:hypothetical protein
MLLLVPFEGMGRKVVRREGKGHVADGDLIVCEGKLGHTKLSFGFELR